MMSFVLPRGSVLPASGSGGFCTTVDYQTGADFKIYEGERIVASENNPLGNLQFYGLPPAKAGVIRFTATFQVDLNGILSVTAVRLDNNESKNCSLNVEKGRLSPQEIKDLIEQAEFMRAQDRKELDRIKAQLKLHDLAQSLRSQNGLKSEAGKKILDWIKVNQLVSKEKYEEEYQKLSRI
jgi:molecular chaperone DnaK (HSP70)